MSDSVKIIGPKGRVEAKMHASLEDAFESVRLRPCKVTVSNEHFWVSYLVYAPSDTEHIERVMNKWAQEELVDQAEEEYKMAAETSDATRERYEYSVSSIDEASDKEAEYLDARQGEPNIPVQWQSGGNG